MCYHRGMRAFVVSLMLVASAVSASAADQVAEARRLYNLGQYAMAEQIARQAAQAPATANAALVVLGRIQLERFRQSADIADFNAARTSLNAVDPRSLESRERIELLVGLAEALYLEDRFAAAAELFETVFDRSNVLGMSAHERVLDWWATAIDREAQIRPADRRARVFERISTRMTEEIQRDPGSPVANYWLAVSARGAGDIDGAWNSAIAAWVRSTLSPDTTSRLRDDLDRLVTQALIPERSRALGSREPQDAVTALKTEWELIKEQWK